LSDNSENNKCLVSTNHGKKKRIFYFFAYHKHSSMESSGFGI
jgi:hypothetical protein